MTLAVHQMEMITYMLGFLTVIITTLAVSVIILLAQIRDKL